MALFVVSLTAKERRKNPPKFGNNGKTPMAEETKKGGSVPEDWFGKARKLLDEEKWGEAITLLSSVIRGVAPDSATAYTYRGIAYAQQGEYNRAIQDWEEAAKLTTQKDKALVEKLLTGISATAKLLNLTLKAELASVEGFKERERDHRNAQKRAGTVAYALLFILFAIYITAFTWLVITKDNFLDVLPWVPVLFLSTAPIIWAIRMLNREKTRHFALRENAYANQLMTLMVSYNPRGGHAAELSKKLFDHHRRGAAQLIIALENGKHPDDGDSTIGQVVNTVKGVKESAE